jgi:microsomal dipeptidase-like Zn-dependent dipeptidase
MFFDQHINFASRDPKILVDLHKMTEGHLDATIMVAYLEQQGLTDEDLLAATAKANRILNEIEAMVAKSSSYVNIAYTPTDLYRLKAAGKKAIMLGIENGYAIGHDIANVKRFRNRGVVYMTLCHNGNNQLCGSCRFNDENLGVNAFGEQVIREMNRVGMMVDISHAGIQTFYDALDISQKPIVASHSSSRALCNHPRNLTDEQMKALASKGGVAQVTLYNGFLKEEGTATIQDAITHLNHMVDVMGIEHVGIGTDFDGDGGIIGCASASELINFTRHLLKERYSEEDIRRIWGGNFLRVMEEVQNIS